MLNAEDGELCIVDDLVDHGKYIRQTAEPH